MLTNFLFDLQRFGGKGGTTVTQSYEPTEFERGLQELEYNFALSAAFPSAMNLNGLALGHLNNSGNSYPIHYDDLFIDADGKIKLGIAGLSRALGDLDANAPPTAQTVAENIGAANDIYIKEISNYGGAYLDALIEWINGVPVELYQDLKSQKSIFTGDVGRAVLNYGNRLTALENALGRVPASLESAIRENANDLASYGRDISSKAKANYNDLDALIPKFKDAVDKINTSWDVLREDMRDIADENHGNLNGLIPKFACAACQTNTKLTTIDGDVLDVSTANYSDLEGLTPKFTDAAEFTNANLSIIDGNISVKADDNYGSLSGLISEFTDTADATNASLSIIDGNISLKADDNYGSLRGC